MKRGTGTGTDRAVPGPEGEGMEVRIRLFDGSGHHESADGNGFSFTTVLPDGTTIRQLLRQFGFPNGTPVVVVTNDKSDNPEYVLKDQDSIDIFGLHEKTARSRKGIS